MSLAASRPQVDAADASGIARSMRRAAAIRLAAAGSAPVLAALLRVYRR